MSVAAHLGIRLRDYDRRVRTFIPHYEEILSSVAEAAVTVSRRRDPVVLDLGIGTGALTAQCLERLPAAHVIGIDQDAGMLNACSRRLPGLPGSNLVHGDFAAMPLPGCDLIVATLALHHVRTPGRKRAFYRRCFDALTPAGALITGDCCPSSDARLAANERLGWLGHLRSSYSAARTASYLAAWAVEDRYFPLAQELEMLTAAGFDTDVTWRRAPFAVIVGRKPRNTSLR
jgi:SAM-dependent methyltransferase